MKKLIDKDGTELFEYKIEIVCSPKVVEYIAGSKEEARDLFLKNNPDLDDNDISVEKNDLNQDVNVPKEKKQ